MSLNKPGKHRPDHERTLTIYFHLGDPEEKQIVEYLLQYPKSRQGAAAKRLLSQAIAAQISSAPVPPPAPPADQSPPAEHSLPAETEAEIVSPMVLTADEEEEDNPTPPKARTADDVDVMGEW
jgi:hypothetical protein